MARKRTRVRPRDPFDPFDGPVDHTIDLHGLRADQSRALVLSMIGSIYRKTPGALVHVITGKGRGSAGALVLKRTIRTLLGSGQVPHVEDWATDLDDGGYMVRLGGRNS